jgi:putative two-component system response regulator
LILLDIDLPEMDGFQALSILKADEKFKEIPVIFLTAKNDPSVEIRGFEMGALDFILKPFSPPVLIKRIETHIETDKLIKRSLQNVRKIHLATISVIANMVEGRDKITGKHIARTQRYLEILVNELIRTNTYTDEIVSWDMNLLIPSAQLHDVGKNFVPDSILNKPGRLTDEEFELIKHHCADGERIIDEIISQAQANDGFLIHAKRFAGYHHERWNGGGYPHGLSGEDIPLEGRIMAIADVYDALVSERSYKKPFTHEKTVEIITNDSGRRFDPKIVQAFINVADEFWAEAVSKTAENSKSPSSGDDRQQTVRDVTPGGKASLPLDAAADLLRVFRKDAQKAITALRDMAEAMDLKQFTAIVHGMKTALANIGENVCAQKAASLENAGLNGDCDYISVNSPAFIAMLESLLVKFAPVKAAEINDDDINEDTGFLALQLRIIKAACENYDAQTAFNALDKLKEVRWRSQTFARIREIRDMLYLKSDFDGAAEIINNVRNNK